MSPKPNVKFAIVVQRLIVSSRVGMLSALLVVQEHRAVHDVLRVVLPLTESREFFSEMEMKPHFASLQHFLKFKQHYQHNHFLNNQVTADLKIRREKEYNTLKNRLLTNQKPFKDNLVTINIANNEEK